MLPPQVVDFPPGTSADPIHQNMTQRRRISTPNCNSFSHLSYPCVNLVIIRPSEWNCVHAVGEGVLQDDFYRDIVWIVVGWQISCSLASPLVAFCVSTLDTRTRMKCENYFITLFFSQYITSSSKRNFDIYETEMSEHFPANFISCWDTIPSQIGHKIIDTSQFLPPPKPTSIQNEG